MYINRLSPWTIILIVIMLLLAGCGGQKYVLQCNITTQDFSFEIIGEDETGTVTQTSNNETTNYEYDSSGQISRITVNVNRDLVFEKNQHKYHIEGIIELNPITNELTYDITATGDAFGNSPQTCKSPNK